MPFSLYGHWMELDNIRKEYNEGMHNTTTRLVAQQWAFDVAKKSNKHDDKKENKMAEKHPHLPVVAATAKSADKVSSGLQILRDSMENRMTQVEDGFLAVVNEIREMRRVSSQRDR
jgi:hypothetical protein